MKDALKVFAKPVEWSESDAQSDHTKDPPVVHRRGTPERVESTDEKALDRWFLEQRGSKRVPKRLEVANELLVANGGPLKMTGNITLVDEEGTVTHANHLSLCRCGASKSKPICDDQHLEIEFFDNGSVHHNSVVSAKAISNPSRPPK